MTEGAYSQEYIDQEIAWEEAYIAWLKFEIGLTKLKTHRGRSNRIFEAWKSPEKYGLDTNVIDLKIWLPLSIDNLDMEDQMDLRKCLNCCLLESQRKLERLKKTTPSTLSILTLFPTELLAH
jgi:hypothetical protein